MAKSKIWCQSIGKFENPPLVNEDSAKADSENQIVAVSDGAGGGGVFADLWSRYLMDYLPSKPILSFDDLDKWIEKIWEPFYDYAEQLAQRQGGLLLDKFYDEGSFATLVAIWRVNDESCRWVAYGDSVAFCYNSHTGVLKHSFSNLYDFNNPPYLLNCKDEINPKGFNSGEFKIEDGCIVFCTSDALAAYIISCYELSKMTEFSEELDGVINQHSKNSVNIEAIKLNQKNIDFYKEVLQKLVLHSSRNSYNFGLHLQKLRKLNMLSHDDYSIAVMCI